jgi:hypothetical protein
MCRRSIKRPQVITLAMILLGVCLSAVACGDPLAPPDTYNTYRLRAKGLTIGVPYPGSWGSPYIIEGSATYGPALTWHGPSEMQHQTSPGLQFVLQDADGDAIDFCERKLVLMTTTSGPKASIGEATVAGKRAVVAHHSWDRSGVFSGPHPSTERIACIDTTTNGQVFFVNIIADGAQQQMGQVVFDTVLSRLTISASDSTEGR